MKTKVSITIDADLADELDRLAERLGDNRSATFERCLRAGIREGNDVADLLSSGFVQLITRALARGETPEVQRELFDMIEHLNEQKRGKRGPKRGGGRA